MIPSGVKEFKDLARDLDLYPGWYSLAKSSSTASAYIALDRELLGFGFDVAEAVFPCFL